MDKFLPEEYKNIARIRQGGAMDNPAEVIPVKTSGDLTAEVPSDVQKTLSAEAWKKKLADFAAKKAAQKAMISDANAPEIAAKMQSEAPAAPAEKFGFSNIGKGALKAMPFLNIATLPGNAARAMEQRPDDSMGQAGIMAGIPAELLPAQPVSKEEMYQELRKRIGADNPA